MFRSRRSVSQESIREILQSVEDALIDAGYHDYMIATRRGTWHWQTVELADADDAGK